MAWFLVSISLIDLNHGRIILSWNHFWKIKEISCCFKVFWKSYYPRRKILYSHITSPFPIEHSWEENSTTTLSERFSYENHKTVKNLQEALKCPSDHTCGSHRDLHLNAKRNNWCILLLAGARGSSVYVHCVTKDFVSRYIFMVYSVY